LFEDVAQKFYDVLTLEQELNSPAQEGMDIAGSVTTTLNPPAGSL